MVEHSRPLDPSLFFFVGFGDQLATLEQTFGKLKILTDDPKIEVIEHAVFIPRKEEVTESIRRSAGIADSSGWLITDAKSRWRKPRPEQTASEPQYELDDDVIYLGPFYNHYGHFLLESLARTWVLDQIAPSMRILFHGIRQGGIRRTACRILEAFGVPKERILILTEPTRVRSVIVPDPLYRLLRAVHMRAAEPYRAVAERIMAGGAADLSEQPVYLSRRLLPADRREIVGEAELEEVLCENGFRIAYPETMSFEDQVRLFNHHTDFFACDGSSVHNVLFALSSPRLHILTAGAARANYLSDYFLVATAANATATFVNCLGSGCHALPQRHRRHFPDLLDMEHVIAYLNERGYLRRRLRAALASRGPGSRQRFEESWLCSRLRLAITDSEELSLEELLQASEMAENSWPLSLMLAKYYLKHDPDRVDGFLRQFAELAMAESDIGRLARFRPDVDELTTLEGLDVACSSETESLVAATLAERFPSEVSTACGAETAGTLQLEQVRRGRPVLIAGLGRSQLLGFLPKGGIVAEVGVFRGDFSSRIRKVVEPETLHLIDPWDITSGSSPREGELNPEAYERVVSRFSEDIESGRIVIHRGYSSQVASNFADHSFDWVYIDAMHDYDNVMADLLAFKDKVKPDGFILGHDFSNSPMSRKRKFGVVAAVREFTCKEDFDLEVVTNEAHPSYLLARSGNTTTWPVLRAALINRTISTSIEVDESLFDRFELVGVPLPDGGASRIIRIG